jgi:Ca-activated chloride channel family protein
VAALSFSHPWLLLLALLPLVLFWLRAWPSFQNRRWLSLSTFDWLPPSAWRSTFPQKLADLLRPAAMLCLVAVVSGIGWSVPERSAIPRPDALVIVLDVSSSMTAQDYMPGNRLEVAKRLLSEFVSSQSTLEMGLILFAASPQLAVPVTTERHALLQAIGEVMPAGYGQDGTAIGSAIASAINRLRNNTWGRRRILLVTDGVNNRGPLSAEDGARIAAGMGIRIDTVGIGTDTVLPYWVPSPQGTAIQVRAHIAIDDKALQEIASITGGSYRRTHNPAELRAALLPLVEETGPRPAATSRRSNDSLIQLLGACSILLLCAEFALKRVLCPELPG